MIGLTVYQAIKAGVSLLAIATHIDQEWSGEEVENHKVGVFLTMREVMANPFVVLDSIKKMFSRLGMYRENMKRK